MTREEELAWCRRVEPLLGFVTRGTDGSKVRIIEISKSRPGAAWMFDAPSSICTSRPPLPRSEAECITNDLRRYVHDKAEVIGGMVAMLDAIDSVSNGNASYAVLPFGVKQSFPDSYDEDYAARAFYYLSWTVLYDEPMGHHEMQGVMG